MITYPISSIFSEKSLSAFVFLVSSFIEDLFYSISTKNEIKKGQVKICKDLEEFRWGIVCGW